MQHVLRYEGSFERNFAGLRAGASEYEGDDGEPQPVVPWPAEADGVLFGFMEQRGKRFLAVRVRFGDDEIVLHHPVRLDSARHLGGRRFSARPIPLSEATAGALFGDIVDLNPELRAELTALRDRVRHSIASTAAADRVTDGSRAAADVG